MERLVNFSRKSEKKILSALGGIKLRGGNEPAKSDSPVSTIKPLLKKVFRP